MSKPRNPTGKNQHNLPTDVRFWSHVDKSDDCWIWTASRSADGYGRFRLNHKLIAANRMSWKIAHGEIPAGMLVLHRCDNPPCVNPEHLFLGTDKDNAQDSCAKGRRSSRPGETNPSAKLTDLDVRHIRIMLAGGWPKKSLARLFGVSIYPIQSISTGKKWGHVQ